MNISSHSWIQVAQLFRTHLWCFLFLFSFQKLSKSFCLNCKPVWLASRVLCSMFRMWSDTAPSSWKRQVLPCQDIIGADFWKLPCFLKRWCLRDHTRFILVLHLIIWADPQGSLWILLLSQSCYATLLVISSFFGITHEEIFLNCWMKIYFHTINHWHLAFRQILTCYQEFSQWWQRFHQVILNIVQCFS